MTIYLKVINKDSENKIHLNPIYGVKEKTNNNCLQLGNRCKGWLKEAHKGALLVLFPTESISIASTKKTL